MAIDEKRPKKKRGKPLGEKPGKEAQKSTNYVPTKAELRLLEVLFEPESRLRTVSEVCRLAPCDRKIYYKAFNKPGFEELYMKQSMKLLRQHAMPMIHSLVREATRGGAPHLKMGLEMADLYNPKTEVKHSGSVEVTDATAKELMDFLRESVDMSKEKKEEKS